MKEMLTLMKTNVTPNPTNQTNEEEKKKREEKQKKYCEMPECKHCGKKHPSKKKDKCWELEKNASSCPAMWKSTKST
jgi:hypothetical protein